MVECLVLHIMDEGWISLINREAIGSLVRLIKSLVGWFRWTFESSGCG